MTGLRPYPEYEDSGVEWLGAIPAQWPVKPANAVVRERKVRSVPGDEHLTPSQTHGVLPQSEYMSRTGNKVVLNLTGADSMRHVEPNDFISHLRSFQGGFEHSRLAGKVSAAYTVLEPLVGIVPEFYRYLFKSAMYVQALQTTTDQLRDGQSIRFAQVVLLPLPVPDMETQKSVVTFLDRETAQIDAFIADQEELIGLLAERRVATVSHAVTKGLDSSAPMADSGVVWLGEVPSHWTVRSIRTLSAVRRGASPRPIDDPIYFDDEGEWAWVRIQDVTASKGSLFGTTQRLSNLGASLSVKLAPGSLFLSIAGSVGKPCITEIPCCIHDGFVYFLGLDQLLGRFLFRVFESGQPFLGLGKMGTQLNLNTDTVGGVAVVIPPVNEIRQILEFLDQSLMVLDSAIADAHSAIALSRERRAALISAAVTGKIDVRNAA